MKNRTKRFVLIFIFSLGAALCFFIFFAYIMVKTVEDLENIERSNIFQLVKFKRSTNETSKAFVSLSKQLKGDYYYYFSGDDGSFNVISEFSDHEFECYGTCSCSQEARRTAGVISKGVYLLISCISSIVAMNIAINYFKNDCGRKLSEICEPEAIQSKVDDCKIIDFLKDDGNDGFLRRYKCLGNCVINQKLEKKKAVKEARKFGCSRRKAEGNVRVFVTTEKDIISSNRFAREKFRKEILSPFCLGISKYDYWYDYILPTKYNRKDGTYRSRKCKVSVILCSSTSTFQRYSHSNIKCILES